MSEATIKAQIKGILEGVSGVGVVYTRRRYSRSRAVFRNMMTSDGKINACMVYRAATPSERFELPNIIRYHQFRIDYLYELDDETASEDTFQALLDAIFDAFKSNYSLNGTVMNSDPLQIEDVDTDWLDSEKEGVPGTLVHRAELSLRVEERVTYTP
jgi:hypothetical protein